MADDPKTLYSDTAYSKTESTSSSSSVEEKMLAQLRAINEGIGSLSADISNMSQANATTRVNDAKRPFGTSYKNTWGDSWPDAIRSRTRRNGKSKGIIDSFEESINEALFGDLKKELKAAKADFAKQLGINLEDVSSEFGKRLGERTMSELRDSSLGKKLLGPVDDFNAELIKYTKGALSGVANGGGLKAVTSGLGALGKAAGKAALPLAAVTVGLVALDGVLESATKLFSAWSKAANRSEKSRAENMRLAQERLVADVRTMVEEPFNILKSAVNDITSTWDSSIQIINQTQGYTKADLQSLMGNFAERARSEGLGRYISTADVTKNLTNVLQSGLSGKIAEEFAYQATVLGAAIPTQDFFSYASTYASVAANAVKAGKSQADAIAAANESLSSFANSLLYASRELSGGFTTGLQNASDLYDKAVKISLAARTGNSSNIAGVLSSVAAVTGSIAPDLASSMTDLIYNAAVGGNATNLVALRSLAGINAGNTDFLAAFARDPQKIFANIFTNLAGMYNSNSGAYMEVAEGFANLFGMSQEAFQRIDFNYLANAVSSMNVASGALDANMALLRSGQSTLTSEQLKAQQINEYMIEEGLAYVLDSEAGRAIQEHMWAEQIAREQMEAEYGVNLVGDSLDALESLAKTARNILNILNPVAWIKKIDNVVRTYQEENALEKDIAKVLEATKVGGGNASAITNLLTRNADLNLTPTLAQLLTGSDSYSQVRSQLGRRAIDVLSGSTIGRENNTMAGLNTVLDAITSSPTGPSSVYSWGSGSKSASSAIYSALSSGSSSLLTRSLSSGTRNAADQMAAKIERMLSDEYLIEQYVKQGKTYEEFAASAKSLGISNFSSALSEAGYSETDVRGYFESQETQQGALALESIRQDEKDFRDAGRQFWRTDFWEKFETPMFQELKTIEEQYLQVMIDEERVIQQKQDEWKQFFTDEWLTNRWDSKFWKVWKDEFWARFNSYFFEHKIYSGGTLKLNTLQAVQKKEKKEKGDLTYALSEYLTRNNQNLEDLKDPTIQTNMLLAQILMVTNAIMNQNETQAVISLPDTLAAMATGTGLDSVVSSTTTKSKKSSKVTSRTTGPQR